MSEHVSSEAYARDIQVLSQLSSLVEGQQLLEIKERVNSIRDANIWELAVRMWNHKWEEQKLQPYVRK